MPKGGGTYDVTPLQPARLFWEFPGETDWPSLDIAGTLESTGGIRSIVIGFVASLCHPDVN